MKFKVGDKIVRNNEVAGALTIWNFSFAQNFEIEGISTTVDGFTTNYIVKIGNKIEYLSAYQVDRFYDLNIKELRKDKLLKIRDL